MVRRRLEVAGDELELPAKVAVGYHARLLPQPHLPHPRDSRPMIHVVVLVEMLTFHNIYHAS